MEQTTLGMSLLFLLRFLKHPIQVASIWPSSTQLACAMIKDLAPREGDLIVEYGPGTGSFTVMIDSLLKRCPGVDYLGIESDRAFCSLLEKRFPHLKFFRGQVERAPEILNALGLPRPRYVISGIPLILMSEAVREQIVSQSVDMLAPEGLFRTVSYVHSYPRRGARWLRKRMRELSDVFQLSGPYLNVPPALVLSAWME